MANYRQLQEDKELLKSWYQTLLLEMNKFVQCVADNNIEGGLDTHVFVEKLLEAQARVTEHETIKKMLSSTVRVDGIPTDHDLEQLADFTQEIINRDDGKR